MLDVDIQGATGCLIHITGGPELTLGEANGVGEMLTERIDSRASVIWGARVDENYNKRITVMTIMTGVHSAHILGGETKEEKVEAGKKTANEYGIKTVY